MSGAEQRARTQIVSQGNLPSNNVCESLGARAAAEISSYLRSELSEMLGSGLRALQANPSVQPPKDLDFFTANKRVRKYRDIF